MDSCCLSEISHFASLHACPFLTTTELNIVWVWTRCNKSEIVWDPSDCALRASRWEPSSGISLLLCLFSQYGHTISDGITGHTRGESQGTSSEPGFSFPPRATSEEALRGPWLRKLQLLHRQINMTLFYWSALRAPINLDGPPPGKHSGLVN